MSGFPPTFSTLTWERPTHQPVAGFTKDPYLNPASGDSGGIPGASTLPDIVTQAALDFFYKE